MDNPSERIWRFEEFEFREVTGELQHRGEIGDLRPQAAKLLTLLLANAGQVVTRDEIQGHLWPDTVVDFEQGLNTAVRQLRRALEEEAASPRFVQTVPRRGYRWIGPLETLSAQSKEAEENRSGWQRQPMAWAAALLLVAVCGLAAASWLGLDDPVSGDQQQEKRLLVLPLRTLGWQACEDQSSETLPGPRQYLADALTEELISEAASLSAAGIKILGRASTRRFGDDQGKRLRDAQGEGTPAYAADPLGDWDSPRHSQLRDTLRADYLLKGSLRCSSGQVRVSLRLIDARDGSNLWGESYDRPLGGLSNIHRRTVDGLAAALGLDAAQPDSIETRGLDSPSPTVLKAEYLLRKSGRSNPEMIRDYRLAHQLLLEAVETDPRDARAHLGLVSTYLSIDHRRVKEHLPLAQQHLKRAIELRPDMAEAHAAKAAIETFMLWDLDSAQVSFQRSLQLNPHRAQTHYAYAYFFLYQQRNQDAVRHMEMALDIDPVSSAVRGDLGWVYFSMRRYREAIRESRRTLELEPSAVHALMCLLWSHRLLGEDDQAAHSAIQIAEQLGGGSGWAESLRKLPVEEVPQHYFRGRQKQLLAQSESQPVHPTSFAFLRAGLKDADGAMQALEAAYEGQFCHFLPLLDVDPRFDFLHGDPRYQDLVERIRRDTRLPSPVAGS